MPNYENGKIYTIRCISNKELIYVGSSCQKLCTRWMDHKSRCKQEKYQHITLYKTMIELGINDFYIELYQVYPCQNKEELTKREGEVIREIGTLNHAIPGRSRKEYFEDNKLLVLEKTKKYYNENSDIILEKKKDYYINVVKPNYEKNKETILEKRKEKITCECGSTLRKADISQHLKCKKHLTYLSLQK